MVIVVKKRRQGCNNGLQRNNTLKADPMDENLSKISKNCSDKLYSAVAIKKFLSEW